MAKRNPKTEMSRRAPGFPAEGIRVPASVVRRYLGDARSSLMSELNARATFERRAARAITMGAVGSDAQRKTFRQRARSLRKDFASRALALPAVFPEVAGVFGYTVNLAPTYAFAHIDGDLTGHGNSSLARRSTGQLELRFFDRLSDQRIYFSLVELGGFFFPSPGASRITARVNPTVAYSWYMDSEGSLAFSDGFISLKIVGFKGSTKRGEARSHIELWRERLGEGRIGTSFDFRTAVTKSLSTSLTLNGSDFYLITFRCISTFASGGETAGLPTFVTGSIVASLPAIALDVKVEPSISQR